MRVLIADQCSGSKSFPDSAPVYDVEEIDNHGADKLREESPITIPARELYDGRQQRFVDDAVVQLRDDGHTVDRLYVSAGFGLVEEETRLPPYEATFREMDTATAEERARTFSVTEELVSSVADGVPYDIVFFPLGDDYVGAMDLDRVLDTLPSESLGVLFNRETVAAEYDRVISLAARTPEAEAHGTITVAIKGQYLKNFAARVGKETPSLSELAELCTRTDSEQIGFDDF